MNDYLSRVVADSLDRVAWTRARYPGLGASDAASFAKLESVEAYTRAKLSDGDFSGNEYTRRGNEWEQWLLAAAGFEQNTLMFHAIDEPLHLATPDGIQETNGALILAEGKTKLVPREKWDPSTWKPTIPPAHRRQIAWAQYVLDADFSKYIVLPCDENHRPLTATPAILEVDRDDALIAKLLEIARPVLAAMKAARAYEQEMNR